MYQECSGCPGEKTCKKILDGSCGDCKNSMSCKAEKQIDFGDTDCDYVSKIANKLHKFECKITEKLMGGDRCPRCNSPAIRDGVEYQTSIHPKTWSSVLKETRNKMCVRCSLSHNSNWNATATCVTTSQTDVTYIKNPDIESI